MVHSIHPDLAAVAPFDFPEPLSTVSVYISIDRDEGRPNQTAFNYKGLTTRPLTMPRWLLTDLSQETEYGLNSVLPYQQHQPHTVDKTSHHRHPLSTPMQQPLVFGVDHLWQWDGELLEINDRSTYALDRVEGAIRDGETLAIYLPAPFERTVSVVPICRSYDRIIDRELFEVVPVEVYPYFAAWVSQVMALQLDNDLRLSIVQKERQFNHNYLQDSPLFKLFVNQQDCPNLPPNPVIQRNNDPSTFIVAKIVSEFKPPPFEKTESDDYLYSPLAMHYKVKSEPAAALKLSDDVEFDKSIAQYFLDLPNIINDPKAVKHYIRDQKRNHPYGSKLLTAIEEHVKWERKVNYQGRRLFDSAISQKTIDVTHQTNPNLPSTESNVHPHQNRELVKDYTVTCIQQRTPVLFQWSFQAGIQSNIQFFPHGQVNFNQPKPWFVPGIGIDQYTRQEYEWNMELAHYTEYLLQQNPIPFNYTPVGHFGHQQPVHQHPQMAAAPLVGMVNASARQHVQQEPQVKVIKGITILHDDAMDDFLAKRYPKKPVQEEQVPVAQKIKVVHDHQEFFAKAQPTTTPNNNAHINEEMMRYAIQGAFEDEKGEYGVAWCRHEATNKDTPIYKPSVYDVHYDGPRYDLQDPTVLDRAVGIERLPGGGKEMRAVSEDGAFYQIDSKATAIRVSYAIFLHRQRAWVSQKRNTQKVPVVEAMDTQMFAPPARVEPQRPAPVPVAPVRSEVSSLLAQPDQLPPRAAPAVEKVKPTQVVEKKVVTGLLAQPEKVEIQKEVDVFEEVDRSDDAPLVQVLDEANNIYAVAGYVVDASKYLAMVKRFGGLFSKFNFLTDPIENAFRTTSVPSRAIEAIEKSGAKLVDLCPWNFRDKKEIKLNPREVHSFTQVVLLIKAKQAMLAQEDPEADITLTLAMYVVSEEAMLELTGKAEEVPAPVAKVVKETPPKPARELIIGQVAVAYPRDENHPLTTTRAAALLYLSKVENAQLLRCWSKLPEEVKLYPPYMEWMGKLEKAKRWICESGTGGARIFQTYANGQLLSRNELDLVAIKEDYTELFGEYPGDWKEDTTGAISDVALEKVQSFEIQFKQYAEEELLVGEKAFIERLKAAVPKIKETIAEKYSKIGNGQRVVIQRLKRRRVTVNTQQHLSVNADVLELKLIEPKPVESAYKDFNKTTVNDSDLLMFTPLEESGEETVYNPVQGLPAVRVTCKEDGDGDDETFQRLPDDLEVVTCVESAPAVDIQMATEIQAEAELKGMDFGSEVLTELKPFSDSGELGVYAKALNAWAQETAPITVAEVIAKLQQDALLALSEGNAAEAIAIARMSRLLTNEINDHAQRCCGVDLVIVDLLTDGEDQLNELENSEDRDILDEIGSMIYRIADRLSPNETTVSNYGDSTVHSEQVLHIWSKRTIHGLGIKIGGKLGELIGGDVDEDCFAVDLARALNAWFIGREDTKVLLHLNCGAVLHLRRAPNTLTWAISLD